MNTQKTAATPADALDRAIEAVHQETFDPLVARAAAARVWNRLAAEAQAATGGEDAASQIAPIEIAEAHPALVGGAGAIPSGARQGGAIEGCTGFQSLIPAFLSGSLPADRARLVEDHTRECVACRRALREARRGSEPNRVAARRPRLDNRPRLRAYAWAAGLAAMLLAGFLAYRVSPLGIGPVRAEIASIEGELLLDGTEPLAAGAILERDQVVRTTSRSGAVLQLADGSRVELAERSVLRLDRRRDGTVLNLEQGGLIVEASEQRGNDHLYVRTNDCLVSVTGTIFSVSHGAKGSRVSVLRGEVQIEQRNGGGTNMEPAVLRSGDQFTSRVDLAHVPLDHDVRWSRDASRYREDIAALRQIGHELDRALASPARTSTRLLDLLPASTAVYVAVPNVSASLGEAWDRLREQTDANPALAAWWAEHVGANGETAIQDALSELRTLGAHLGPEAVAAVVADASLAPNTPTVPPAEPEDTHDPVVLAEVLNPAAFSPVLDAEIARFNQRSGQAHLANTAHAPTLRRVQSVPAGAAVDHEVLVWLRGDLLLISSEPSLLAAIDAVAGGQPNGFVGSTFHARLASIYREGAGWVAGLDARSAMGPSGRGGSAPPPATGFDGLDSIVFNASSETDATGAAGTSSRALVSFADERHGIASWLAAPAPSGALEFVSPDARLAVAVLLKEPADMLDDLLQVAQSQDPNALQALARFEAEHGVAIREDLAATLGGDIAFAFDGPWLPQPTWKLVVEVVDAPRLQSTIAKLVEEWNRAIADRPATTHDQDDQEPDAGERRLVLSQEATAGRQVYKLVSVSADGSSPRTVAHYLYEGGYLVAGPNPALLVEAVTQRNAGITLASSGRFTTLLPADGQVHFSAVVYQDLGAVAGMVGEWLADASKNSPLGNEGREQLTALSQQSASLMVAYGLDDAVEIAGRSTGGVFGLGFEKLLGLAGALNEPRREKAPTVRGANRKASGTKSRVAA